MLHPPVPSGDWVQVLAADPQLADAIPEAARDDAALYALAHSHWLEPGEWQPEAADDAGPAGQIGLLILEGFVIRQVRVIDRPPVELLGPGDILHPWEPERTEPFKSGSRYDVLEPTRMAVLDRRFAAIAGRWPDLMGALFGRAIGRSRSLLLNLAVGQLVGVDIRLLVMLWHIAERWGVVDTEGGGGGGRAVPVHLTHQVLARLISAQRPTVTSALATLAERGLVTRGPDGRLVLHGDPPTEFRHLRSALP